MNKCIIIGGGILGATTAYRLAKNGIDVTVIDQKDLGQATDAAAGIISPWLAQRRNKAWLHLANEGARLYPSLIKELNKDGEAQTGYTKAGALNLYNNEEKLKAAYDRGMERMRHAPEMGELTILNAAEIEERFPLVTEGYKAIHISGAAKVDGRLIRDALLNAAKKYGAKQIFGKAEILHETSRVTGVQLNGETLTADTVICTSGAWMNETLKPLGIEFNAKPKRGQILHFHFNHMNINHWPVVVPPNNLSIVPFSDRLVIGATHESNAGFEQQITAGGIHEILTKALEVMPNIADWSLLETRVGFRPFTPQSLPVLGAVPGFNNLLIANGLGASGLTTGPYFGEQMAKLVMGDDLDIDLANYDVNHAIKS